MADVVRYELHAGIATLLLDDGKANALSPAVVDALGAALDAAERDANAILLAGRAGRFSAGFDLSVMRQGPEAMRALVGAGARFGLRLYESPKPVVVACTGHAIAMGAILLLCADRRIGARGDFKLGLNEVAIGMALPGFACELAQARLSRRHLQRAAIQAEIYDPEGAVDAGFLDACVEPDSLEETARSVASGLAQLDATAFRATKQRLHAAAAERIRAAIKAEFE